MKRCMLIGLLLLMCGCASFFETTGTRGISYGMSKERVLGKLQKTDKIIAVEDSQIICEGIWDLLGEPRRKVFTFEDNRLIQATYHPIEETQRQK